MILALLAALEFVLRRLPRRMAMGMGAFLGRLFYALVPYERNKTLATLKRAYPERDEAWRRRTGAAVFGNLGRSAVEFFRMKDMTLEQIGVSQEIEVVGLENIMKPHQEGRGVVAVTGHFGNWELLAAWMARLAPVGVVARQVYDPRLDQALNARRAEKGVTVFSRNTSVRPILRWLKDGKILGVLADQDTAVDSLFVEFFGTPAKTPAGPAVLAQATGAALLTVFCHPKPEGGWRLVFSPEIPLPARGDGGPMELWDVVQEYTRRTEAAIRSQPEVWAWNHPRWRSDLLKPSNGWNPRLAAACLDRIAAWRAAGRPPLA